MLLYVETKSYGWRKYQILFNHVYISLSEREKTSKNLKCLCGCDTVTLHFFIGFNIEIDAASGASDRL